jgi:hypothetical protein
MPAISEASISRNFCEILQQVIIHQFDIVPLDVQRS